MSGMDDRVPRILTADEVAEIARPGDDAPAIDWIDPEELRALCASHEKLRARVAELEAELAERRAEELDKMAWG